MAYTQARYVHLLVDNINFQHWESSFYVIIGVGSGGGGAGGRLAPPLPLKFQVGGA